MQATPLLSEKLSDDQLQFYRDNGFLALQDAAAPDEVETITRIARQLLHEKAGADEGALFDMVGETPLSDTALTQMLHPSNYSRALRKVGYRRRLRRLARQILGPHARFSGDHIVYKPPRCGPVTPWHQDEAFRDPSLEYREVSFWLALQDVDEANGCLKFVPGTHREEVKPHRRVDPEGHIHGLVCTHGFDEHEAEPCPLPAGGCTLHHGRTLHGAGPNRSSSGRLGYVVHFDLPRVAARAPRSFEWLDKPSRREEQAAQWRRGAGRYRHILRRCQQASLSDPYRLFCSLKRYLSRHRHTGH